MSGQIFNLRKQEGLGIVTFDVVDDEMNTWTEAALADLREVLVRLERSRDLIGVIFISTKPDHFFAGSNLKMIEQMQNYEQLKSWIDPLHDAFNRLSTLDIPTLAAINGVCTGGGLELCLACTARIATNAPGTMIGLPESKAGFFPGGGGTQRLPRLIGYQAVKLILQGDLLSAAKSHELGIIDRLTPSDKSLLEESITFLREILAGKVNLIRISPDLSQIEQVADTARKNVLKAAKGREIPGPILAIKAIQEGIRLPLLEALEVEKKYFIEAVLSSEVKGSITPLVASLRRKRVSHHNDIRSRRFK